MKSLLSTLAASSCIFVTSVAAFQGNAFPPSGSSQEDFIRWGAKESALFVVIVVILYFYRRDFLLKINELKAERAELMTLVASNTVAMVELRGTNARLARAVEANNNRHRADDETDES